MDHSLLYIAMMSHSKQENITMAMTIPPGWKLEFTFKFPLFSKLSFNSISHNHITHYFHKYQTYLMIVFSNFLDLGGILLIVCYVSQFKCLIPMGEAVILSSKTDGKLLYILWSLARCTCCLALGYHLPHINYDTSNITVPSVKLNSYWGIPMIGKTQTVISLDNGTIAT